MSRAGLGWHRKSRKGWGQSVAAVAERLEGRLLLANSVIYVDLNAPGPAHDGLSWQTAYLDLQPVLLMPTLGNGDRILVADGTYKPATYTTTTDRAKSFVLKNGVSLEGGYAGASNKDAARDVGLYPTILSGNIGTTGNNSYHVVVGSGTGNTAVLDGFTISAGNANGASPNNCGGGMYNSSGSPTIRNCTFSGNTAGYGGGMYNSSSSPTLTNCTFSGNTASSSGGGMDNSSSSSPRLTNCTFSGNTTIAASGIGGGMYNSSSPTLSNCIIWGNTASNGPQIYQSGGTLTITYSDIQGGWAGTGNINLDPLFVRNPSPGGDGKWGTDDDDDGDLHLLACSPVADAGNNSAPGLRGIGTDLSGSGRFLDIPTTADTGVGTGPIVDMGAYEAVPALSAHAGGSYFGLQGRELILSGRGANMVAGDLQYAWEWTGNGAFDDGTGPNPWFPTSNWALFSSVTVSLRVTDSRGLSTMAVN